MITERTLKKWRRAALIVNCAADSKDERAKLTDNIMPRAAVIELTGRILRMTQELLDQHLLRK